MAYRLLGNKQIANYKPDHVDNELRDCCWIVHRCRDNDMIHIVGNKHNILHSLDSKHQDRHTLDHSGTLHEACCYFVHICRHENMIDILDNKCDILH